MSGRWSRRPSRSSPVECDGRGAARRSSAAEEQISKGMHQSKAPTRSKRSKRVSPEKARAQALARVERRRPDLAARVKAGELGPFSLPTGLRGEKRTVRRLSCLLSTVLFRASLPSRIGIKDWHIGTRTGVGRIYAGGHPALTQEKLAPATAGGTGPAGPTHGPDRGAARCRWPKDTPQTNGRATVGVAWRRERLPL
jgi:hypothetical protein